MFKEKMNIREAQKHAKKWVRSLRAAEALEAVCDAVVDAEDRIGMADLHVKNSRDELSALENDKEVVRLEILALAAAQEDLVRQGKTLAETLAAYKEQVNKDISALDGQLEDHTENYNEAIKSMEKRKEEFVDELKALRVEKEHIESVVEAFRKANTLQAGD